MKEDESHARPQGEPLGDRDHGGDDDPGAAVHVPQPPVGFDWYLIAWRDGQAPQVIASGMTARIAFDQAIRCKQGDPGRRYFLQGWPGPGPILELVAEAEAWQLTAVSVPIARLVRGAVHRRRRQEEPPLLT